MWIWIVSVVVIPLAVWYLSEISEWYTCLPRFDGLTVVVTGASSGIGEQMAKDFNSLGAKKVIIAARRVSELERVKKECRFPNRVQIW